jgi:tetratricopeptide (TPR) repeat protein
MSRGTQRLLCWAGPWLFLTVLLASCVSTKNAKLDDFTEAPLFGMVYDHDNRPVTKVDIQVDGKSVAESDLNGRFVIPQLAKGTHSVVAAKSGYEPLSLNLQFDTQTQVLYIQMFSESQLLSMAETALGDRDWAQAEDLLGRAEGIDAKDPVYRYLVAIYDFRTGKVKQAAGELSDLIASGVNDPSVYLFLADIYQYSLGSPKEAIPYLERYLDLKGDDAVAKRLDALQKGLSGAQTTD